MNANERRLILDRGFERALETVLEAFLREGFLLEPVGAGDLHRPGRSGRVCRYAMLDAALPELMFRSKVTCDSPAVFACRVSVFELTDSCTLITAESPVVQYPALATLVPRLSERVGHVMRALLRTGALTAA